MSVLRGEADLGLCIEAAADSKELDFIPLLKERYDLVIPKEKYKSRVMVTLLKIIKSADFKEVVANIGGYDTSQTGCTTFV
jgi:putative molybdopterin biosynthesis protein